MAAPTQICASMQKKSDFESFVDDFQEQGLYYRGSLKTSVAAENIEDRLRQSSSHSDADTLFQNSDIYQREKSIFKSLVDEFEEDNEFYRGVLKQDASLERLELQLKLLGVAFNTSKNHKIGASGRRRSSRDNNSLTDKGGSTDHYGRFLYSFKAGTFKISMASPFTVRQSICKSCMFGPDRHKIRRKTEERLQTQDDAGENGKKKRKYCGTKKKSCPAKLIIRKVTVFPDYTPKKRTKYALDQKTSLLKKHLAAGGDDSGPVNTVDLCFIAMTKMSSHQNHSFDETTVQRAQNVDPRVAKHIMELVRKGCTDYDLIQRDLKTYVENVLFKDIESKPSPLSRAFYPSKHDINNHIYVSMKRLMRDGLKRPREKKPVRRVIVSKKGGCFEVRTEETLKEVDPDDLDDDADSIEVASSSLATNEVGVTNYSEQQQPHETSQNIQPVTATTSTVQLHNLPAVQQASAMIHLHDQQQANSAQQPSVSAGHFDIVPNQHHVNQNQLQQLIVTDHQTHDSSVIPSISSMQQVSNVVMQSQSQNVVTAPLQQNSHLNACLVYNNPQQYQNEVRFCREQMRETLNDIYHAIYYCEDLSKLQRTSGSLKRIASDLRSLQPMQQTIPSSSVPSTNNVNSGEFMIVHGTQNITSSSASTNSGKRMPGVVNSSRRKQNSKKPRLPRSSSLRAKYIEFWKNKNRLATSSINKNSNNNASAFASSGNGLSVAVGSLSNQRNVGQMEGNNKTSELDIMNDHQIIASCISTSTAQLLSASGVLPSVSIANHCQTSRAY